MTKNYYKLYYYVIFKNYITCLSNYNCIYLQYLLIATYLYILNIKCLIQFLHIYFSLIY